MSDTTALLAMLDELKAKREKATPEEWEWARLEELSGGEEGVHVVNSNSSVDDTGRLVGGLTICRGMTGPNRVANAQYIAHCSPTNMLALEAAVRELIAENERLRQWKAERQAMPH